MRNVYISRGISDDPEVYYRQDLNWRCLQINTPSFFSGVIGGRLKLLRDKICDERS